MADRITETDVIQIQAQDSDNNRYSFNVENPKANTTISNVREAFQPLINSGKWVSKQGYPFSYISQATLTKTKKIELADSGATITATPSEVHFEPVFGDRNVTITVDGSPITGYDVKSANGVVIFANATIDPVANTITFFFTVHNVGGTTEAIIVTAAGKITIPFTVSN